MLEHLVECAFSLNRHREAPLLKEREAFLLHLQVQGTRRAALPNLSGELIQVVRLLRLQKLRDVRPEEELWKQESFLVRFLGNRCATSAKSLEGSHTMSRAQLTRGFLWLSVLG